MSWKLWKQQFLLLTNTKSFFCKIWTTSLTEFRQSALYYSISSFVFYFHCYYHVLLIISRGTLMEIRASRIFFRYIPAICDLEILHKSHWAQGTQISLISLYFNETWNNVISTLFSPPVPIGVYLSIDRFIYNWLLWGNYIYEAWLEPSIIYDGGCFRK